MRTLSIMKAASIFTFFAWFILNHANAQEMGVVAEPDTRNSEGYYTSLSIAERNDADVNTLDIQRDDGDRFLQHPHRFPNVETININFSRLTRFESIRENRNLKKFEVHYSWRLASLPEDITDLPLLESITFSSCGLQRLPDRFFQSKTLTSVCICYNNLHDLPEIPEDNQIRQLYLDINPIDHLPVYFKNLQTLEVLGLKDCLFSNFPNEILALKNLKVLDLSANSIAALPDKLKKLKKLERLYLIRTSIKELPRSLRKSALKYVYMSNTNLSEEQKIANQKSLPEKCKLYWTTALNLAIDNSSCTCMKPSY